MANPYSSHESGEGKMRTQPPRLLYSSFVRRTIFTSSADNVSELDTAGCLVAAAEVAPYIAIIHCELL